MIVRARLLAAALLAVAVLLAAGGSQAATWSFTHGDPWWGGGFSGSVAITNDSGQAMSGWSATMTTTFSITGLWNADFELVSSGGGSYTYSLTPKTWNADLAAGATLDIGFNGQSSGTIAVTSLTLGSGTPAPEPDPEPEPDPDPEPEPAAKAPGTPHIAWMPSVQETGDFTVAWDMWWGENGRSWRLYANDELILEQAVTANTPYAQHDEVELADVAPGAYAYKVELCSGEGETLVCTASDTSTVTVKGAAPGPSPDPGGDPGYEDDRDLGAYSLDANLAFQIHLRQGETRTWTFDKDIASVISRRPDVAEITVAGREMTAKGVKSGRTGLRITSADGKDYYTGLRVDLENGELPGLPDYLAVGSVSEDTTEDLSFWQDMGVGNASKRMDVRYIYINGGPLTGWTSWQPDRARKFARESLKFGLIPFFVFYNIPDGGESYWTDLQHIQDPAYMKAYYENLSHFLAEVTMVMKGELYGVVLEPDFLGYMQQNSGARPNDINTTDGTLADTVERINRTIADQGENVAFGWQLNLWARGDLAGGKGIVRRTDDDDWQQLGWYGGRDLIREAARDTAAYAVEAGILSHGADFVSIDKYGLDAGFSNPDAPWDSIWFWNADHWDNYLLFARTLGETTDLPVVLWQIPVGHINTSTAIDPAYAQPFPNLPNTYRRYEDSAATWFFGDTFAPGEARLAYFAANRAEDPSLAAQGTTLAWGSHMRSLRDAGVSMVLFGAGVGESTDGIGTPPSDGGFWMQKVREYYQQGPVPLNPNADLTGLGTAD